MFSTFWTWDVAEHACRQVLCPWNNPEGSESGAGCTPCPNMVKEMRFPVWDIFKHIYTLKQNLQNTGRYTIMTNSVRNNNNFWSWSMYWPTEFSWQYCHNPWEVQYINRGQYINRLKGHFNYSPSLQHYLWLWVNRQLFQTLLTCHSINKYLEAH